MVKCENIKQLFDIIPKIAFDYCQIIFLEIVKWSKLSGGKGGSRGDHYTFINIENIVDQDFHVHLGGGFENYSPHSTGKTPPRGELKFELQRTLDRNGFQIPYVSVYSKLNRKVTVQLEDILNNINKLNELEELETELRNNFSKKRLLWQQEEELKELIRNEIIDIFKKD